MTYYSVLITADVDNAVDFADAVQQFLENGLEHGDIQNASYRLIMRDLPDDGGEQL